MTILKSTDGMTNSVKAVRSGSTRLVHAYATNTVNWPRGYKTFFMLNSAEHEICPADKYQITKQCNFFLVKNR